MSRSAKDSKKNLIALKGLKFLVITLFGIFFIFFLCERTFSFFRTCDHFLVKEIWISPSLRFINSRELTKFKGKSMFDVDLKTIRRQLQAQYPEVDQLKIIRKFPNKIWIVARKRDPFAFIAMEHRQMVLDENGVVLSVGVNPNLRLPVIGGVHMDQKTILGQPLKKEEVDVALEIIKATQDDARFIPHKITMIDVSNLSRINCQLSNNLQVIMDRDKIFQKVRDLGVLFSEGHIDFNGVEYIDLRFKEPLIRQKTTSN